MQFGYAGRPDETFRDANAFDPNDLNKAYYETIDRGIAAELSKRHGIEAQFNKTSGRLDAVRIADNAKFSYDVETTDSNSSTGHPVPEGTLRDLASKAYYHPMTVARNVRDCPIQGGLPNPYVRKKE